jgi:hypothetical protein
MPPIKPSKTTCSAEARLMSMKFPANNSCIGSSRPF